MSNTPDTGGSPASSETPPPDGGTKTEAGDAGASLRSARVPHRLRKDTSDGPFGEACQLSRARENVPDVKIVGNGDAWKVITKASSDAEGWMKSTKAMNVPNGVVIQVTTQQRSSSGYALAEALTFVPSVKVVDGENGGGLLTPL